MISMEEVCTNRAIDNLSIVNPETLMTKLFKYMCTQVPCVDSTHPQLG
jgi:hypothetical protein